jgi:glucose-specific phosphotransferase system IIA component
MFRIFKKKEEVELIAPITGKLVDITAESDQVFSQKMVGDGIAIEPEDGLVVAPCRGRIVQIFSTNHAIGIETEQGIDVLIHLGLDTVELKGEGFERIAKEGQIVKPGDLLIKMDLEIIKNYGKSTITPFIITNIDKINKIEKNSGSVKRGKDKVMTVQLKK